ncbi:MAG: hypothetical protein QW757_00210 [Candidatus Woesearchaeota archaeon]
MIDKDKVLAFVKQNGPVLPRDVSKEFKVDTFFTGAILSTLVENKELKITNAKIGGSPLYYCEGQEHKLDILYKYLPGKEKEAYNFLKEKKVVRENNLEPAIRVAIKNIKDFAKPLEVNVNNNKENNNNNKEIFWKWYLISNAEAEKIIRDLILQETYNNNIINQHNIIKKETKENLYLKEEKKEDIIEKKIEEKIDEKTKENLEYRKEKLKEYVQIESKENEEIKNTEVEIDKKEINENKKEENKEVMKKESKKENLNNKYFEEEQNKKIEQNEKLSLDIEELLKNNKDSFFNEILNLFKKNNVDLLSYKIIRKNSDFEFYIIINTGFGKLNYFCKAKDKKKIDDKELSSIYVLSQMNKLPILYLSKGELTKKAKEILEKEFKNICFYKL